MPSNSAQSQNSADDATPAGVDRQPGADPAAETPIVARSSVIADGVMTEERLLYLISLEHEEDALDFKLTYDVRHNKDVIECVKVLVCMANTGGGYIVLGVDEVKEPGGRYTVAGCPEDHVSALDPTDLHNKFERYVEEPLGVHVRVHRPTAHGGVPVVMLFVAPTRTMPLTFKIQGEYPLIGSDGKSRMKTEFRPGEIWVRRGAACVMANARDLRRIRSDMRQAEREKWTEDLLGVAPLVQRMDRVAALLERLLESRGTVGTPTPGAPPGLTSTDYLLPPRQLAERLARLMESDEA